MLARLRKLHKQVNLKVYLKKIDITISYSVFDSKIEKTSDITNKKKNNESNHKSTFGRNQQPEIISSPFIWITSKLNPLSHKNNDVSIS